MKPDKKKKERCWERTVHLVMFSAKGYECVEKNEKPNTPINK